MQPVIQTHDDFLSTRRGQFRHGTNCDTHELLPLLFFVERIDHLKSPFHDSQIHDLGHLARAKQGDPLHTALGKVATQLGATSPCLTIELKRELQELVGQSRLFRETMWSEKIIPSTR